MWAVVAGCSESPTDSGAGPPSECHLTWSYETEGDEFVVAWEADAANAETIHLSGDITYAGPSPATSTARFPVGDESRDITATCHARNDGGQSDSSEFTLTLDPPGVPAVSISARPSSSRGVYEGTVEAEVRHAPTGARLWMDLNADGERQNDEVFGVVSTVRRDVVFDNRSSETLAIDVKAELFTDRVVAEDVVEITVDPSYPPEVSPSVESIAAFGRVDSSVTFTAKADRHRNIERIGVLYWAQPDTVWSDGATAEIPLQASNDGSVTDSRVVRAFAVDDTGKRGSVTLSVLLHPYQRLRGVIRDVLSRDPIPGATVEVEDTMVTTSADGTYRIVSSRRINKLIIRHDGYQTYTTYAAHTETASRGDFSLIPTYAYEDAQRVIYRDMDGQTVRYDTFPVKLSRWITQPTFVIDTTGISPNTLEFAFRVLEEDLERLTGGFIKNVDRSEVALHAGRPNDMEGTFLLALGGGSASTVDENGTTAAFGTGVIVSSEANFPNRGSGNATIRHEVAHALGHFGHYDAGFEEWDHSLMGGMAFSPVDVRNGIILYNRPPGSVWPDNAPDPERQ